MPGTRKCKTWSPIIGAANIIHRELSLKNTALDILLVSMLWLVRRLIINVNVGSLNIRKIFQLNLQLLGDIMCVPQRGSSIHDDINFRNQSRAGMIDSDGIDSFNFR